MSEPRIPTLASELLFSKVSHDLASPIGATENGLELLAEDDGSMAGEAMELVQQSARSTSARLRFYRLCYGTVGACKGMNHDTVRGVLQDFYRFDSRLTLQFDQTGNLTAEAVRLLFCLSLCCSDALPYGGTLTVSFSGDHSMTVTARSARPERGIKRGTLLPYAEGSTLPENIGPGTIHAWYTGFLAHSTGLEPVISEADDGASLTVTVA